MKKVIFLLVVAILLGGGAVAAMSGPAHAQGYEYGPQPADPYSEPWVGPGTPWVYYNGDWFLNGILYYFFGPTYGWCPYYSYPPVFIVRTPVWYGPRWNSWFGARPQIIVQFNNSYPYWKGHSHGRHYDRSFYEQHHRGQGAGWQEGFRGKRPEGAPGRQKPAPHVTPPAGQKPGPTHVTPPERQKPAPSHVTPPAAPKPGPTHVAPPERQHQAPPPVAPREGTKPAPSHITPPPATHPAPSHVAPPSGTKPAPAPAHVAPPAARPAPPAHVAPPAAKPAAPAHGTPPAGSKPAPAAPKGEEKH